MEMGFLHPLIILDLGLRFNQPEIITQPAVTEAWIGMSSLLSAEKLAEESGKPRKKKKISAYFK
jgi:hypothetical protein